MIRLLMGRVRSAESQRDSCREIVRAAVAVIAEKDRQIARLEGQRDYLRAQLRAATTGRTIADETAILGRAVVALPILRDEPRDEFSKAAA